MDLVFRRIERQQREAFSEIDEGGITRHRTAANDSPLDRITMTPQTARQVREVFVRYGFPAQPETWQAFRAVQIYITEAEACAEIVRNSLDDCSMDIQLDFIQRFYAPYAQAVVHILDDDWSCLVAYHHAHRVYDRLVSAYREHDDYAS
ncbi:hypothetical protein [Paraburkholderia adhaesiva]|uniref:hypothetical protein n=1 Tax=Paraburkholderia adhaesiva TaxID=2883244 RepID=UPI001F3EE950|nr:hypothetical protein [Paraburkholderia adhaesiva]